MEVSTIFLLLLFYSYVLFCFYSILVDEFIIISLTIDDLSRHFVLMCLSVCVVNTINRYEKLKDIRFMVNQKIKLHFEL